MIRSMTGFARAERETPWGRLACEIRSVNHRYLDVALRLPETLRSAEPALRERIRKRVDRGRLECQVRLERSEETAAGLALDTHALQRVVAALGQVRDALGDHAAASDPVDILRWPGVVREQDVDPEEMAAEVTGLAEAVLETFVAHREREGARLADMIRDRLAGIEAITGELRAASGQLVAALRSRLAERARAMAVELDAGRLEQEVALLAQKADVAEELDRLDAHLTEVRGALDEGGPVGRRLDFLAQELNREANTLASKATGAEVASRAVELKVLIEQIREQIQNLE